jgi:ubiquinone biosynthesis protein Coq4
MLDNGYRGVFRDVIRGARRGRKSAFLPAVYWEDHWERPLEDVRRDLGIEPS